MPRRSCYNSQVSSNRSIMKLSLQIKLGQQLTMTPQLQQAIKLLQLSTLDLQQEIQQALESNPMLELEEDFDTTPGVSAAPESETQLANTDNDDNRHAGDTSDYSSEATEAST